MAGSMARYVLVGLVAAAGCTHDYDQFSSPDNPGTSGNSGSAGSSGALGSLSLIHI